MSRFCSCLFDTGSLCFLAHHSLQKSTFKMHLAVLFTVTCKWYLRALLPYTVTLPEKLFVNRAYNIKFQLNFNKEYSHIIKLVERTGIVFLLILKIIHKGGKLAHTEMKEDSDWFSISSQWHLVQCKKIVSGVDMI